MTHLNCNQLHLILDKSFQSVLQTLAPVPVTCLLRLCCLSFNCLISFKFRERQPIRACGQSARSGKRSGASRKIAGDGTEWRVGVAENDGTGVPSGVTRIGCNWPLQLCSNVLQVWIKPIALVLITWKTLHTTHPPYLSELITYYHPSRALRSSNTNLLARPSGINGNFGHFLFLHHPPGTHCQCYFSNVYEYGNENGYYSFYENEN